MGTTTSDTLKVALPPALGALAERLTEGLGVENCQRILDTMRSPKVRAYWANPLRGGVPLPDSEPVDTVADCWVVPRSLAGQAATLDPVKDGRLYLLNPSSMLAVLALAPEPEEELLDLAAAPGGKTLLMAAAMRNTGRIAAVEPVKGRFHRMRANLDRCGVTNVAYYAADGRAVGRKVPGRFHAVLLDAPCSSEARIRLDDPQTFAHWKPRKIKEAARKQRGLLRSAFAALKVGGRLVYSTCSFAPEENEANLAYLLSREPGAEVVPLGIDESRLSNALLEWRGHQFDAQVGHARRVLPDHLWDGFFLAKVVKRV